MQSCEFGLISQLKRWKKCAQTAIWWPNATHLFAFLFTYDYIYLMCSTQVHSWSSSFAFRSVKRAWVPSRDFNTGQLRTCLTRYQSTQLRRSLAELHGPNWATSQTKLSYALRRNLQTQAYTPIGHHCVGPISNHVLFARPMRKQRHNRAQNAKEMIGRNF